VTDLSPTTQQESEHPLVPCHGCGYSIPRTIGATCPECNAAWTPTCDSREVHRNTISNNFTHILQAAGVAWFIGLVIYGVGASVAAVNASAIPFLVVFLGVGFGVVVSNAAGIGIARMGPEHQFKLMAAIWVKNLYWLHMPWLSIAAFTIVGTMLAVLLRIFPSGAEDVLFFIVLVELVAWGLVSILTLIKWFIVYGEQRGSLGIKDDNPVAQLHCMLAILVWLGCVCIGFFGGLLGTLFMTFSAGIDGVL
jgi:hypothetical protein